MKFAAGHHYYEQINVKNAVYKHVNGKIAQLKQQMSELGF